MTNIKRIAFLGAESSGKTTLATALAAHFKTQYVPEYGRIYVDEKGRLPRLDEMLFIGQMQVQREIEAEKQANKVLFCDTTPLTTAIYSQYYFGECASELLQLALQRHYDGIFLTDIDIPWVADGIQRDGEETRAALHLVFVETLQRYQIPFKLLSGNLETRMSYALAQIHTILER